MKLSLEGQFYPTFQVSYKSNKYVQHQLHFTTVLPAIIQRQVIHLFQSALTVGK